AARLSETDDDVWLVTELEALNLYLIRYGFYVHDNLLSKSLESRDVVPLATIAEYKKNYLGEYRDYYFELDVSDDYYFLGELNRFNTYYSRVTKECLRGLNSREVTEKIAENELESVTDLVRVFQIEKDNREVEIVVDELGSPIYTPQSPDLSAIKPIIVDRVVELPLQSSEEVSRELATIEELRAALQTERIRNQIWEQRSTALTKSLEFNGIVLIEKRRDNPVIGHPECVFFGLDPEKSRVKGKTLEEENRELDIEDAKVRIERYEERKKVERVEEIAWKASSLEEKREAGFPCFLPAILATRPPLPPRELEEFRRRKAIVAERLVAKGYTRKQAECDATFGGDSDSSDSTSSDDTDTVDDTIVPTEVDTEVLPKSDGSVASLSPPSSPVPITSDIGSPIPLDSPTYTPASPRDYGTTVKALTPTYEIPNIELDDFEIDFS
ncbi:hypothetical protein LTR17_027023, partial [Elasticomyces elasticus]